MTHLNKHCPEYCLMDSSNANEKKFACDMCFRNSNVNTSMMPMKDIWGNVFTGNINPDGSMNTYVNGELLVRGVHPKKVNKPQWNEK